jgi:parvulin-like peptidyl-prolyl isomerase
MKKLLIAGIILLGLIGYAKADANKVITDITSAPAKLQTHIQSQIEDAKEYQKNSWAEAKLQLLRLKAKFIKN